MAAAYVNKVMASSETSGTTLTVPNVPGSTGNKIVLLVIYRDDAGQTFSSEPTYGATAMTQIGGDYGSSDKNATVWELDSPAGTENITFTLSANTSFRMAVAFVLSGAGDIGTPLAAVTGGNDNLSQTVTSETDGICLDFVYEGGGTSLAADAGQSNASTQGTTYLSGASTEAGAASVTMGWTWSGLAGGLLLVVPVAPAAAGSGILRQMMAHHEG